MDLFLQSPGPEPAGRARGLVGFGLYSCRLPLPNCPGVGVACSFTTAHAKWRQADEESQVRAVNRIAKASN